MSTEKTIYDLKLHEAMIIEVKLTDERSTTMLVTRVSGGFIYDNSQFKTSTFVPYNDEFKKNVNEGNYAIG